MTSQLMSSLHVYVICVSIWIHPQSVECHELHGLRASPYKEGGLTTHQMRGCTKCASAYSNCEDVFWEYYERVEENGEDQYLNPWLLSQNHVMLSCLTEDLESASDRKRKKRGLKTKSTIIPTEKLRVRHTIAGQRAMSRHKRHENSILSELRSRVKREDAEEQLHSETEGVIYMVKAYYGKDFYGSCSTNKRNDYCQMNAFDDKEFMIECNGAHRCWILGVPAWLSDCGGQSDYLHVEYQCIPEESLYRLDHEIMPDQQYSTGYMMTPFYPEYYHHLFLYECNLEMADLQDSTQKFVFTVLDFHLEPRDSENCCTYDFVEIQDMNSNNQITSRERVCGDIDPGHTYVVRGTRARLVFHTDSSWDERGLWVKYAGKSQYGDKEVALSCGFFHPDEDDLPEVSPDLAEDEETKHCRQNDDYDTGHYYDYNDTYWYNWETWSPRTMLPPWSSDPSTPSPTTPYQPPTTSKPSTPQSTTYSPTPSEITSKASSTMQTTAKRPISATLHTRTRTPSVGVTHPLSTTSSTVGTGAASSTSIPTTAEEPDLDGKSDAQVKETEGDSSNVAIIGGAVGAVVVTCIAVVIAVVFIRRCKSAPKKDGQTADNILPSKGAQLNNMNYSKHNYRGDGNEYCGLEPTAPSMTVNAYELMNQNSDEKPVYNNNSPNNYLEPQSDTYEILPDAGVYEELPGLSNPGYDSEIPIKPAKTPSGTIPVRLSQDGYVNMTDVPSVHGNSNGVTVNQNTYDYIVPTSAAPTNDLPKLPLPKKK